MARLRIQPHGRLQEWVAHEKGYFQAEGLDYVFTFVAPDEEADVLKGAYELYREGRGAKGSEACDVSSACHWAVNEAAAQAMGRMWGGAYSVVPAGIYVAPESEVHRPEELAGIEIGVGYHSGSHFAALQGLEVFLPPEEIRLRFIGRPMARLDAAIERSVPAVSSWGVSGYVLEQLGFRRVLETTFMVGFLFPTEVEDGDIRKFLKGIERAQMDIDLAPERYKHYYLKELPERFHDRVDVRLFGPGERVVFLPYTREMYERTRSWMAERRLFGDGPEGASYESAVRR